MTEDFETECPSCAAERAAFKAGDEIHGDQDVPSVNSPVVAEFAHKILPLSIRILGPSKYSPYFKVQVDTEIAHYGTFSQGWPTEAEARNWANTMWATCVEKAAK